MYVNYGDKDFFEYGILVDAEHSDTEFQMLLCRPYDDEENKYQFGQVMVDITDSWIDRAAVMSYIGMTEEDFDPIQYAIGCTGYYSWDNFGIDSYSYGYDWQDCDHEVIENALRGYLIANDNLDMPWIDDQTPWQWECTDGDDFQYGRKVGDGKWHYIQFDRTPEGFGDVREETISLADFTPEEVEIYVAGYYKSMDNLKEAYPNNWEKIACECIFEQRTWNDADSHVEAANDEEAERIIKNYIWLRKGVVW